MNELVRISNQAETVELMRQERERARPDLADVATPVQDPLDQHLDSLYLRCREHRKNSGIDDQILNCTRAFLGEYTPEKLSQIRQTGGAEVYMGLTGTKCRAGIAWLLDIFSSEEDKTWGLKPTPEPDLSPSDETRIVQAAQQRMIERAQQIVAQAQEQGIPPEQAITPEIAERIRKETADSVRVSLDRLARDKCSAMEIRVQDQMLEGGWPEAFSGFIWDLVTNKAGVLKGPITRTRKKKRWTRDPMSGQYRMDVALQPVLTFERVSPLDVFPSPQAVDFTSDFFERVRYTKTALQDVMSVDGYNPIEIMAVIQEFENLGAPSLRAEDRERATLEGKDTQEADSTRDTVEGYEAWVSITGKTLKESGIAAGPDGAPLDDLTCYDVAVIKIKEHRIFFGFNPDPLGRKPYYKQGWSKIPGSFWYQSVPELMDELQLLINASMRSLANNMVLSSGPQVGIYDIMRVHNTDVTAVHPMKIWMFTNRMNSTLPPLQFFQPDSNAKDLMSVYDKMATLADSWTGIPAYEYGTPSASAAGRTSSGLGMLMSSAARGIKRVILDIDTTIFKPVVEALYDYNMSLADNPDILGDMEVVATGAVQVLAKESLADRRLQFLQATANEMDFKVMGPKGRARLLSAAAEPLALLGEPLVQTEDTLEQQLEQEQQMEAQQAQAEQQEREDEMNLKRADVELRRRELDLKTRELEGVKAPMANAQLVAEQERSRDSALRTYLEATREQGGGASK